MFKDKSLRNNDKLPQYTVGKYGLKKIEETNYDISKHKVFTINDFVVGIGIDEIDISKDICGSISPVYDVYTLNKINYINSLEITLKKQLINKKNILSRKSTRREFEIDKNELKKFNILVCDNSTFSINYNSIMLIKKTIEILEKEYNSLIQYKQYLLDNMFI